MVRAWNDSDSALPISTFVSHDPPGGYLGSGGATISALRNAWKTQSDGQTWATWLSAQRRVVLHGGGQSRRLPAYSVVGKPLLPVPVLRWSRGQRLDQTLLEVQLPEYLRIFDAAPAAARVMLTSGDVLLQLGSTLPRIPDADIVGMGVLLPPEEASDFGVFFLPRGAPQSVGFFLQKPNADRIRELAGTHAALADSGVWLLSERALEVLWRKTGGTAEDGESREWSPRAYELYAGFGLALGDQPAEPDPEISGLSCAVVPLTDSGFHHLGTSRQLIQAMSALHNAPTARSGRGFVAAWGHPDQHLQNCRFELPLRRQANHTLWIENCNIPASWQLACEHVLTNVPDNRWDLRLEPGVCLDFVPVEPGASVVRFYGIDDQFRGALGAADTAWLGRRATTWFEQRGISLDEAGLMAEIDVQDARLFPVENAEHLDPRYLEWLFSATPVERADFTRRWLQATRLSAGELQCEADVGRLLAQRRRHCAECVEPLARNGQRSVFYQLDLESTACLMARAADRDPLEDLGEPERSMQGVRRAMVRAAVMRYRGQDGAGACEETAFECLRDLIEDHARLTPVEPHCSVQDDQIVWGRSPVRLDLAGGWTDTPPYCLENGGRVVNVAVDLNGQPPLQVFARLSERPELVIRSIDLGTEHRIRTYAELETYAQPGSSFALAKAALALSGFLPRFHSGTNRPSSLERQLQDFGGGIEISLLAAVPKGSGLGTSSILSATLLATLGDLCGLQWDRHDLFARTLALEQMVTTGGGWQDQAGGLFRGIKLIETEPGMVQRPTLRWLPDHLFSAEYANRTLLLYYTGLTRMAKGILHEGVRGVFLKAPRHLEVLEQIGATADLAFAALQEARYDRLADAVRRSWELNQDLDRGTNPPEVQEVINRVQDYLSACKLLGAGGGGYLLMLAKDADAASRVRAVLEETPPNARARFVQLALSETGLQLTRS
jgi:galactokinase/mevalonate kinase-like predicted kinase